MNRQKIIPIIVMLLIWCVSLALFTPILGDFVSLISGNKSWKPAVTNHVFLDNSHFKEIWSSTVFIECQNCLAAEENKLYLIGSLSNNSPMYLMALDAATGELEWQQQLKNRDAGPLWLTSDRIFVGLAGSQKIGSRSQVWGAAQISTSNKNSGEELWRERIPGANRIVALGATEDVVTTIGNRYFNLVALNVDDGRQITDSSELVMQFDTEDVLFTYRPQGVIGAIGRTSGQTLWQQNQLANSFAFGSDTLLAKSGDNDIGNITAFNIWDGEILWSRSGVIGNIAAVANTAYFLSFTNPDVAWGGDSLIDIQLLAVDIRTGTVLETLEFEPGGIQSGYGHYKYYVAANEENIFVYLGDSRQLFALRFLP
jgi:outer membrane protein assembly factor BamB